MCTYMYSMYTYMCIAPILYLSKGLTCYEQLITSVLVINHVYNVDN